MLNLNYMQIVYLIHILFAGPLLIYIGYKKDKIDKRIFDLILVVGIVVVLYHGYKLVTDS